MMNSVNRNLRKIQGSEPSAQKQVRSQAAGARLLWAVSLAAVGLLSGLTPSFESGQLIRSSAAVAQSAKPVSAENVANFVRAAMAMEPKRQQAVQEIQGKMGSVPAIHCDNRDSFDELDPTVRGVAINYCNESKRIVESSGLTIKRFNEILMAQRSNPALRERIQSEMCRVEPGFCPAK